MPIVTFFLPGGAWRTATLDVGPVHLLLGPVFGAALNFIIVAWLVFWFSKKGLVEGSELHEDVAHPGGDMLTMNENAEVWGFFRPLTWQHVAARPGGISRGEAVVSRGRTRSAQCRSSHRT